MKLMKITILSILILLSSILTAKTEEMFFIKNSGQWNNQIQFAARLTNTNISITPTGIFYDFVNGNKGEVIKLSFVNALNYKIQGQEKLNTKLNFFYGNNPNKWISNVNTYKSVKFSNVFPGIDARIYLDKSLPRYDFVVYPGADASKIKLDISGAKSLSLVNNEIIINGSNGSYKQTGLFAYQVINGIKQKIKCKFEINKTTLTFDLGNYDRNLPLIIDPIIFADYIGGSEEDGINAVKATNGGYIVTAGYSSSLDFKTTTGAYDTLHRGDMDVIVKKYKVEHAIRELIFATYIGGGLNDVANDLDIDSKGIIYLTGKTNSSDFPIINPFISQFGGNYDCFFIRLTSEGDELLNSSYLGGSSEDVGTSLAINPQNSSVAICGYTTSRNFPIYGSADQGTIGGLYDAFITKLRPTHTSIEFSTYWGGTNNDRAWAIAQDNSYLYIGGETDGNFPIKPARYWHGNLVDQPIDAIYNGGYDGFAIKMDATGSGVEFSTYYGGKEDDRVTAVSYFKDGSMLIAGETKKESGDATFKFTDNAFQKKNNGGIDGFIAHLDKIKIKQPFNQKYQELIFSTFFGGSSDDSVRDMSFDDSFGSLYITGNTKSSNFPIVGNNSISKIMGKYDAYIAKFSNLGSEIIWSTLLGGSAQDIAMSCDIDSLNNVVIGGITSSKDLFPDDVITPNEYAGGSSDGFVTKYSISTLQVTYPIAEDKVCAGSHLDIKYSTTEFSPDTPMTIDYSLSPDSAWTNLTHNATNGLYRWDLPIFERPFDSVRIRITHVSGICDTTGYFYILAPAKIISQSFYPESQELCEGDTILIYTEVSGSNLGFQWYLNNQKLVNQTSQDLFIEHATTKNSGKYKLIITGQCKPDATSKEIAFTVKPRTRITLQPNDKTAYIGDNVQFKVEAEGLNLTYKWLRNGQQIIGANQSTYTIENVQKQNEGDYNCIVSGECYSDTSQIATLKVSDASDVIENDLTPYKLELLSNDNDVIRFSLTSDKVANVNIKLVDLLGRNVMDIYQGDALSTKEFTISKNSLNSGIYLLNANDGMHNSYLKIVITK